MVNSEAETPPRMDEETGIAVIDVTEGPRVHKTLDTNGDTSEVAEAIHVSVALA